MGEIAQPADRTAGGCGFVSGWSDHHGSSAAAFPRPASRTIPLRRKRYPLRVCHAFAARTVPGRYLGKEGRESMAPSNTTASPCSLSQDFLDRPAQLDLQPLAAGHLEPVRVEAELVQHGGVDVGHVVAVLDRVKAQLVGRAVDDPAL